MKYIPPIILLLKNAKTTFRGATNYTYNRSLSNSHRTSNFHQTKLPIKPQVCYENILHEHQIHCGMGRGPDLDMNEHGQIAALLAHGLPNKKVAAMVGRSRNAIAQFRRHGGVKHMAKMRGTPKLSQIARTTSYPRSFQRGIKRQEAERSAGTQCFRFAASSEDLRATPFCVRSITNKPQSSPRAIK